MKLTVVLGAHAEERLHLQLNDNDFVKRWTDELRWCLDNREFDRNENFACFLTLEERKQALFESIAVINRFFSRSFKADFIEISDKMDQHWFNYLHEKFEQLSGTYDEPSKLMSIAPEEVRQSVRNLNFFIHLIESYEEKIDSPLHISFRKDQGRRKPLQEEDYALFQLKRRKGYLYLNYAELGKTTIDIYKDGLDLSYLAHRDLTYYNGESQLHLMEDSQPETGFYRWMEENNISDRRGVGCIELGKLVEDADHARKILKNHRHLHSIHIEES